MIKLNCSIGKVIPHSYRNMEWEPIECKQCSEIFSCSGCIYREDRQSHCPHCSAEWEASNLWCRTCGKMLA